MARKILRPDEITDAKKEYIPDGVFDVFNMLITKHWNGHEAIVKQEELMTHIQNRLGCEREKIYAEKYLDVEDIYRAEGWSVTYDKPAYCENYEPYFEFKKQ